MSVGLFGDVFVWREACLEMCLYERCLFGDVFV